MKNRCNSEFLSQIANQETLNLLPNGLKPKHSFPVWFVRVGNHVYVRAYRGVKSGWYQAAVNHRAGRILANHHKYEISFSPVERNSMVNKTVNQKYLAKYHGSSMLWLVENALDSTLEIVAKREL